MHTLREGHRGWLWVACLAAWSWTASSRFLRDTIKIGLHGKVKPKLYDHKKWHYIAKYAFGPDGGEVAIRCRLAQGLENYQDYQWNRITTLQIDFNAYNEKKWLTAGKVMNTYASEGETSQAARMCQLGESPYHIKPRASRVIEFPFEMSTDSDNWGDWVELKFTPEHRAHMWYFTLSDCDPKLQKSQIEFELKMTQADGSEFSVEREYSLPAHYIALAVLLLFMMYWGYRLYLQEGGWDGVWALHPLLYVLTAIMMCQFLGHFAHLDHLSGFQVNGVGNEFTDIAGETLMMLAQVLQVLVLIMLAGGYAIVDTDPPNTELMVPFVLLIIGVHAFAVIISHIDGTEHAHRFHGHEGKYGYFMVFMRLSLFLWFMCASEGTKSRGNNKVKMFLRKLQCAGCFYFLTYPVMWSVIKFVAVYWQHRAMQIALMTMHFLMNVILAHMFLAGGDHFRLKSGWYFEGSIWDEDDPVPVSDMSDFRSKVVSEDGPSSAEMMELSKMAGMKELAELEKLIDDSAAMIGSGSGFGSASAEEGWSSSSAADPEAGNATPAPEPAKPEPAKVAPAPEPTNFGKEA
mmetsp:Transcript_37910/g.67964  ORF Transcript_37910/g.67964 Transcript_37910/m.67964 type:complete len:574 (-) Transcript_37910:194-1915(-)